MIRRKIHNEDPTVSIDDWDSEVWEEILDSGRRTKDGQRYDYDTNHNGRFQRRDQRGYY